MLTAAVLLLSASSCSGIKDIKVTSCSIMSLSPKGLRSLDAMIALGIENPIMAFRISGLDGTILNAGSDFAYFSAGDLPVERRSSKVYPLACSGTISKDVKLTDLLKLAAFQDFSEFTINLSVRIKLKCGLGAKLHFNDLKVEELISSEEAAAWLEQISDVLI